MSNDHQEITCAATQEQLSMLLYGELSFDEEERVESHLDACAECRAALQREKALHAALRTVEVRPRCCTSAARICMRES
jgi:anti-sigma factor RsiW